MRKIIKLFRYLLVGSDADIFKKIGEGDLKTADIALRNGHVILFLDADRLYFTSQPPSRLNLTGFQLGLDQIPNVKLWSSKPKAHRLWNH